MCSATIDAVRWTVTQSIMPDLAMVNHTDATGQTLQPNCPSAALRWSWSARAC